MAELKRSNSLSEIEWLIPKLPKDLLISVYNDHQYYYLIDGFLHLATLTRETILYRGEAGNYFKRENNS